MKILAAIPLEYCEDEIFWRRDLGLVVRALRALGHEAYFVALGDAAVPTERPVKVIPRTAMADPDWWKAQRPDGIILNTWAATRHDDIRSAATAAGCPVIEKLDSDGVKTPRMFPVEYFRMGIIDYNLRHPISQGLRRLVTSLLRTLVVYGLPGILDERIVRCLSRVPLLAAETPLAAARIQRFLRLYQANPLPKVTTVPHPVDTTHIGFEDGDRKKNHVIAVGRWDIAVKGWPLLERTAEKFLNAQDDWKFFVAGVGAEEEGARLARHFPGRFHMLGHLEHRQLHGFLREAKIYALTSHSESFNIAGAEALCSGCSVVGPAQIPSSSYFASMRSGTPSHQRHPDGMLDALIAEVNEWAAGNRDPHQISRDWKTRVSSTSVAECFVRLFEELTPATGASPVAPPPSNRF